MTMTYAEASKIINVIDSLQGLDDRTPAEQETLEKLMKKLPEAEAASGETKAMGQGFVSGASMGFNDEVRGVYNAANEALRSGDIETAKKMYAIYRDLSRLEENELKTAYPEDFSKGKTAGAVVGSAVPMGAAGITTRAGGAFGKLLAGSGSGALAASAPSFGEGEGGAVNRIKNIPPMDPLIGAGFGALSPAFGAMSRPVMDGAKNIFKKGQGGFSPKAISRTAGKVKDFQDSGEDIQQYLDNLGDEGMLADVEGSPQAMAMGLAAMGGTGANVVRNAVRGRSLAAPSRIVDTIDSTMGASGGARSLDKAQQQLKDETFSPLYNSAKNSGQFFDVNNIRSSIVSQSSDAVGDVRGSLNSIMRDLGDEGDISALKLHNIRVEVNDQIRKATMDGAGGRAAELGKVLKQIDQKLDTVEGYATAKAGWAATSDIQDAIDDGFGMFSGSAKTAMDPEDLRELMKNASAPVRDAYVKGARQYMRNLMGTARSDAAKAVGEFEKGFNVEKLAILVGQDEADTMMKVLRAEAAFARSNSDIRRSSMGDFRTSAREDLADLNPSDGSRRSGIARRAYEGIVSDPLNKLVDSFLYGVGRGNLNKEIGQILSLQGDERRKVIGILMDEASKMSDTSRGKEVMDALVGALGSSAGIATTTGNE